MSAGGGAENTDPNRQPPAAVSDLLDAAADSAAAQSDDEPLPARAHPRQFSGLAGCCRSGGHKCCVATRLWIELCLLLGICRIHPEHHANTCAAVHSLLRTYLCHSQIGFLL